MGRIIVPKLNKFQRIHKDGLVESFWEMRSELAVVHTRIHGGCNVRNDLGVVGRGVVTTAFVEFMVDSLVTDEALWDNIKYHAQGTGVGAEAIGNTTLGTENNPGGSPGDRGAGSQEEGSGANVYKSIYEFTEDESIAVTEHGLLNGVTGGILMDRTLFSAINVTPGDKIEFTYQLTCTAGG